MDFDKLLQGHYTELHEIENSNYQIRKQASLSIISCRRILSKMSHIIINTPFQNEAAEILFFKKIKSIPLSQLIYNTKILNFENQYPKAIKKVQTKYIKKEIRKVNRFYDYNLDFIQYVREERVNFDAQFYTRTNGDILNYTNLSLCRFLPEFTTSHDFLLAKVIGFDLYIHFLQNKLYSLKGNISDNQEQSKLQWTSSKAALTELIYALHSSGAINRGAVDLKEIARATERIFNVELKDYYRTFIEIRARKTRSTRFIDSLKESLVKRMEESDA